MSKNGNGIQSKTAPKKILSSKFDNAPPYIIASENLTRKSKNFPKIAVKKININEIIDSINAKSGIFLKIPNATPKFIEKLNV